MKQYIGSFFALLGFILCIVAAYKILKQPPYSETDIALMGLLSMLISQIVLQVKWGQ